MTPPDHTDDATASRHGDGQDHDGDPEPDGDPAPDGDPDGDPGPAGDADPAAAPSSHVGATLLDEDMGPGSAMAHLYRGEIHRMKFWRERLDRTTNWAVIVIAALLTWAFSSPANPHYIILVGVATLSVFLLIEARRYRGYDSWRTRVRIIQQNVWAYGLDPTSGLVDENWRARLGEDYRTPSLKITTEEAIAHRLRRVYLPLFAVLLAAWLIRLTAFAPTNWIETARIGALPGLVVVTLVGLYYALAVIVAYRPRTWHAEGELRSEALRKHD